MRPTERDTGPGLTFAVLLCGVAGAAHFASFAMLAARAPEGERPTTWLVAALGLIVLSFQLNWLTRLASRRAGWKVVVAASLAVQLFLVAGLAELGVLAALTGVVLMLQGLLLSRAADPAPAVLALALSAIQGLLALGAEPGALTLVAFLISAGLTPAAAAVLHAERARRRTLGQRREVHAPRATARELRRRLRFSLGLAALGAVPTLALLALFSLVARIGWVEVLSPTPPAVGAADAARAAELGRPDERSWSARMGFGGAEARTSNDPVAWVRVRELATDELVRDGRPLWLKSMTPDTFTEDALRQLEIADLQLFTDAEDGRTDGWVQLLDPRHAPGSRALEVQVHQRPLRAVGSGGDVLLFAEPPLAVEVPRLRYHPDRAMVTAAPNVDWFAYRVQVTEDGLSARRAPGSDAAAAHPDPRFVQLPDPSAALERIDREARALVRGARTDDERVRRIVAAFQRDFAYTLESTGFTGLDSVVAFLDRREGYCTAFASTAVLMLRGLGIPARGAVGYLVTEWDDEEADYIVRGRHAHAWIEVHFVDRGWVAFDPTPSAGRASRLAVAAAAAEDEGPGGLRAWGAALAADIRGLALAEAGAGAGDVLSTLAEAPEAVLASARRAPLVALAFVALLVTAVLLRLSGRKLRRGPLGVPLPARSRAESFWDRLLLALETHGFHKRPAQTPREFAHGVVAVAGERLAPLATAAELLYRARWGGAPPTRAERREVARFLRDLRR